MNGISNADDEGALPRRMAEGDPTAFADAYDLFGSRLFRTAARYLGNTADAEDVVQELFVALVRTRDRLGQVDNLAAYLFISLRRLVGRVAHKRQQRSRHVAEHAEIQDTNEELALVDLRDSLATALSQLPEEQRDVVILKFDSELTFAEISHVLQISPNTAASRYRYAIEKLRTVLASEETQRERRT